MCESAPRVHTPRTYEHVPYEMTDVYVLARGAPGRRSTGTADPRARAPAPPPRPGDGTRGCGCAAAGAAHRAPWCPAAA